MRVAGSSVRQTHTMAPSTFDASCHGSNCTNSPVHFASVYNKGKSLQRALSPQLQGLGQCAEKVCIEQATGSWMLDKNNGVIAGPIGGIDPSVSAALVYSLPPYRHGAISRESRRTSSDSCSFAPRMLSGFLTMVILLFEDRRSQPPVLNDCPSYHNAIVKDCTSISDLAIRQLRQRAQQHS